MHFLTRESARIGIRDRIGIAGLNGVPRRTQPRNDRSVRDALIFQAFVVVRPCPTEEGVIFELPTGHEGQVLSPRDRRTDPTKRPRRGNAVIAVIHHTRKIRVPGTSHKERRVQ